MKDIQWNTVNTHKTPAFTMQEFLTEKLPHNWAVVAYEGEYAEVLTDEGDTVIAHAERTSNPLRHRVSLKRLTATDDLSLPF
ncbi:hypothetical protein [Neptuniibacter sp. QD37_11]|uniref:hypothetical protein n=1 Tax=Neptuniibacter sp. QD37_11 TaxID=3398209 RepID=UPI0039F4F706